MRGLGTSVAIGTLCQLSVATASAQTTAPRDAGMLAGRPSVQPTRVDTAPDIDGRLTDEAWRSAAVISSLVQQRPLDGAPASEETEIYLAYDDDHLYLGFRVHYETPGLMRANRTDRDQAFLDDLMTVYLDPFLDQQRAYVFGVNAFGVQDDGIVNAAFAASGQIPSLDRSWDALFDTAALVVDDGYTAEMAIPFKSLRYPRRAAGEPHRWGMQIVRQVRGRSDEHAVWAPMSKDGRASLRRWGSSRG